MRLAALAYLILYCTAALAQNPRISKWPTKDNVYVIRAPASVPARPFPNSACITSPLVNRTEEPMVTSTTPSSCYTAPGAIATLS